MVVIEICCMKTTCGCDWRNVLRQGVRRHFSGLILSWMRMASAFGPKVPNWGNTFNERKLGSSFTSFSKGIHAENCDRLWSLYLESGSKHIQGPPPDKHWRLRISIHHYRNRSGHFTKWKSGLYGYGFSKSLRVWRWDAHLYSSKPC